jgi:hypothetical protein
MLFLSIMEKLVVVPVEVLEVVALAEMVPVVTAGDHLITGLKCKKQSGLEYIMNLPRQLLQKLLQIMLNL